MLIVLVGLPGCGKSTIGRLLATRTGGIHLERDKIRDGVFPEPTYTTAEKNAEYEIAAIAISVMLAQGRTVIFDGCSTARVASAARLRSVAADADTACVVVALDVPVAVAVERVERDRAAGAHSATDRTAKLVYDVAARSQPTLPDWIAVVDGTAPPAVVVERIVELPSIQPSARSSPAWLRGANNAAV